MSPLVVLVTAPSADAALSLGRALVDERLAACVSVVPGITSIFAWEGKREEAAEALLVIKTESRRYAALEQRVLELHPYSVPEVLALTVEAGSPAYVQWVRDSVTVEGR
ncbi:MAG: cation tolerance protein CutA [Candidatus Rokubacteria bacterium GWC2_70_24]|nr:MAG: cation tolerance protein CutA [Candidatus Rokubacteria bacterium GWA2_70_23]OGK87810.1 MAG: cation tolerance protein CutA [Candidatus Rokubacteria bacterium GWC2_70_24]OGK88926.1 MAG: cation tolerance protein CutA [Candidatus Rokubacteria bacterium GWF2_70_14]HAM55337.1 divalent-cation tolerance protein CutA [Candidatus Rokubacteria bacterium]